MILTISQIPVNPPHTAKPNLYFSQYKKTFNKKNKKIHFTRSPTPEPRPKKSLEMSLLLRGVSEIFTENSRDRISIVSDFREFLFEQLVFHL